MFERFKKESPKEYKYTEILENGKEKLIQIIPATVIEVCDIDDEEAEFSYKYSFINPINNQMEEAYDYLTSINVGEQIFDIGDEIFITFSNDVNSEENKYIVMRQMVFPEILHKKKIKRRILKICTWVLFLILFMSCCVFNVYTTMPK